MENKQKRKGTKEKQKENDLFLKKHVGLIHCENKLTLMQRKICNILLFNALDKINEQDIYEIGLRQLCSLVGYNSNDIKLIKESVKSLISVVMEWNLLDDSKFLNDYPQDAIIWNASSLLAGASIKNGVIYYSYSPQMKSILSSLDIYGRINLFVQAKFNSTYSLVLYENCVRFKNIKQTAWFPLDLFRSLMGVGGEKYRSFKEFKRNVINVAVKEINQKADISIEAQYKKTGRSVTAIQFLLADNDNYKPTFKKIARLDSPLTVVKHQSILSEILLNDFGFTEKQIAELLCTYDEQYIQEKIELVKSKKNIDHYGAYLISALKKDYRKKPENRTESKKDKSTYQRESKEAHEILPLKNKYMTYKLKTFNQFIQAQSEKIQQLIQNQFEQHLIPKIEIFKFYKKKGLSSPFVMSEFLSFIEKTFPQVIGTYLTFDDYITAEENESI